MPVPLRLSLLVVLVLPSLFGVPDALAVYRCESAGQVTYTDHPCAGTHLVLPDAPPGQSQESEPLARERAELARLQKLREQRERQSQQIRDLAARGAAAREKRCRSLALQLQWREEDLRDTPPDRLASAKKRARRAAEKYRSECR